MKFAIRCGEASIEDAVREIAEKFGIELMTVRFNGEHYACGTKEYESRSAMLTDMNRTRTELYFFSGVPVGSAEIYTSEREGSPWLSEHEHRMRLMAASV